MRFHSVDCEKDFWDVDETIPELSYLTHGYFRYYGKFPSKIGKMIIADLLDKEVIHPDDDFIIDNYSGSGTSLVEAKLAGIDSIGFDINPFAVLAGRVKTYNYETKSLYKYWNKLRDEISNYNNHYLGGLFTYLTVGIKESELHQIDEMTKTLCADDIFSKWFPDDTIRQLYIIKMCLLKRELIREREFFDLAYFSIIRRVSRAYDAEVRPHVNKHKSQRDAIDVYVKKVNEMFAKMEEWNAKTDHQVYSDSYIIDNSDENAVSNLIKETKKIMKKELGAVLSHPPYLNNQRRILVTSVVS